MRGEFDDDHDFDDIDLDHAADDNDVDYDHYFAHYYDGAEWEFLGRFREPQ